MSDTWHRAVGDYRAYRKLRSAILIRDGQRCRLGPLRADRGARDVCTTIATQAHHLDGVAAGHDPQRMIASCKPCNIAEGDPTQRRGNDPPATVDAWWLRA